MYRRQDEMKIQKTALKNIADIIAGQIMNRVTCDRDGAEEGTEVYVLLPSSISGGFIELEKLGYFYGEGAGSLPDSSKRSIVRLKKNPADDPTLAKKMTQKGDIIIKLSSPYDNAIVTGDAEGLLVPSFCAIIRIRDTEKYDQRFIAGYLNSGMIKEKLLMGVNSSAMSMVRMKALEELEIDIPDIEFQTDIGWAYFQSCRRTWMLGRMQRNQQNISDAIIEEAIEALGRKDRDFGNN